MRLLSDNRASRILYNFLSSNEFEKPFLLPCNVCEVIPSVFLESGARFSYLDIDSTSLCVNLDWVLNHVHEFSGLLFVHTYGIEDDFKPLFQLIKERNPKFTIIDDRCLCLPSFMQVGPEVDLCLYSVGERKQVDLGMGGYAFIQDNLNYHRCEL